MFKSFLKDKAANLAVVFGLGAIPLLLAVGVAVDFVRASSSESHLQDLSDAAVLAAAASSEKTLVKLREVAQKYIDANFGHRSEMSNVVITDITDNAGKLSIKLAAAVPTYFMGIANIASLPIDAASAAVRGAGEELEVALVLDSTWSMSDKDSSGQTKLETLQDAASGLVDVLLATNGVRVGLVPYAENINIGLANRNAPWMDTPADINHGGSCYDKTEDRTCSRYEAEPCQSMIDNVMTARSCWCEEEAVTPVDPPQRVCTGGWNETFHGCVAMRVADDVRLRDGVPSVRYPGIVELYKYCGTELMPLGTDADKLKAGIRNLEIMNIYTGHRPETYLPGGLTWGRNILSAQAPYTEGKPYDAVTGGPRKILVLMTDGDNTMRLDEKGKARSFYVWASQPEDHGPFKEETDDDTRAICENIKKDNIEIYTIAFMVGERPESKQLLMDCSSNGRTHYFDAETADELLEAFSAIGNRFNGVRLTN
jgi:Flp pilus assembly protein TadG